MGALAENVETNVQDKILRVLGPEGQALAVMVEDAVVAPDHVFGGCDEIELKEGEKPVPVIYGTLNPKDDVIVFSSDPSVYREDPILASKFCVLTFRRRGDIDLAVSKIPQELLREKGKGLPLRKGEKQRAGRLRIVGKDTNTASPYELPAIQASFASESSEEMPQPPRLEGLGERQVEVNRFSITINPDNGQIKHGMSGAPVLDEEGYYVGSILKGVGIDCPFGMIMAVGASLTTYTPGVK